MLRNIGHRHLPSEHIIHVEGKREVENGLQLVVGHVACKLVGSELFDPNFTNHELFQIGVKLLPELVVNVLHSIDAQGVEPQLEHVVCVVKQLLFHVRVILIQVWQVEQPAICKLRLVLEIRDVAVRMEIFFLVELRAAVPLSCNFAVTDVVVDNIGHYVNIALMTFVDERFQIVKIAKVRIQVCQRPLPITVIRVLFLRLLQKRRYPDRVETQRLYVVQLFCNASVSSSTVRSELFAVKHWGFNIIKPVCQKLIHSSVVPFLAQD